MMSESDGWFTALEHLKSAFKDESTVSNAALANVSLLEKGADENMEPKDHRNDLPHANSCDLVNVDDEYTYRSYDPTNEDRYDPGYMADEASDDGMPGIFDVSSIHSGGALNLSMSQDEGMRNLLQNADQSQLSLASSLDDDDLSVGSSIETGYSTDGGSLLLNVWNEDYEGNPDQDVLKMLIEAQRLPKTLDPYIVNQVQRAKIVKQIEKLEDEYSTDGSCNVMCTQFFIPQRCAEADDYSTASDDSIVDTVINFESKDTGESTTIPGDVAPSGSTLDIHESELNHKKPKQKMSQYTIPKDSEYKPGIVSNELVLMLPKEEDDGTEEESAYPLQFARQGFDDDTSSGRLTYREKDMELTLQKYDTSPHRIAAKVLNNIEVDAKASNDSDTDVPEFSPILSDLSLPRGLEAPISLEKLSYRKKRHTDDDDPIEEDRSILSPEEAEILRKEHMEYLKEVEEMKSKPLESKHHGALNQILGIFNNKQSCVVNVNPPTAAEDEINCQSLTLALPSLSTSQLKENIQIQPTLTDEEYDIECKSLHLALPSAGDLAQVDDNFQSRSTSTDDDQKTTCESLKLGSPIGTQSMLMSKESESSNQEIANCNEKIQTEVSEDSLEENVDSQYIIQERLPIVASSSTESDMLNPVEVRLLSNHEENVCPNTASDTDLWIKKASENDNEDENKIAKINLKEAMQDRILSNLDNDGKNKTPEKIKHFIKAANCCDYPKPTLSDEYDGHIEDLMNTESVTVAASRSGSLGEAEEVVMGVAVEGLRFTAPSSEYGIIIQPQHLGHLRRIKSDSSENDDCSISSEMYAEMILNVTNQYDDDMMHDEGENNEENYRDIRNVGSGLSEASTHYASNLSSNLLMKNTFKRRDNLDLLQEEDEACGNDGTIKNDLQELQRAIKTNSSRLVGTPTRSSRLTSFQR